MCFLSQLPSIGVELACFWSNFSLPYPSCKFTHIQRVPAGQLQRTRFHPKVRINIWLYIIYMQNRYIRSIKHTFYVCPSINFNDILLPFASFRNVLLRASLWWWSSAARCGPAELHYHRYYRRNRRDRPTDRNPNSIRPKCKYSANGSKLNSTTHRAVHLRRRRWKRGLPFLYILGAGVYDTGGCRGTAKPSFSISARYCNRSF